MECHYNDEPEMWRKRIVIIFSPEEKDLMLSVTTSISKWIVEHGDGEKVKNKLNAEKILNNAFIQYHRNEPSLIFFLTRKNDLGLMSSYRWLNILNMKSMKWILN
ncbi:MAG: hypothetical protein U9O55_00985 [Patescibacteria group bacterium]|nr:hypothetical protein [Patescibacteria group bacterium]